MTLFMPKKTEKKDRKYLGMRVSECYIIRAQRVADKQKTSIRAVFEQLADTGLPKLEKTYGIQDEQAA